MSIHICINICIDICKEADIIDFVHFEWDEVKNLENIEKHGVSFEDAQYAFEDTNRILLRDEDHSIKEKRFFCLGKYEGKVLTVRFTYRSEKIRIIGAGYWRQGRKRYETENKIQ